MSRMKDLITDVTFVLVSKVSKPVKAGRKTKVEEVYTYHCKETDAKVTFHAHPTKAWNWVLDLEGTNEVGKIVASTLIDGFCEAVAHMGPKTKFDEVIKEIKL